MEAGPVSALKREDRACAAVAAVVVVVVVVRVGGDLDGRDEVFPAVVHADASAALAFAVLMTR